MKYQAFQQIIDTMQGANYEFEKQNALIDKRILERKNGKIFSLSEHVETMIFAQLSSNRPWKPIENNIQGIKQIFHEFDVEYLKNVDHTILLNELLNIKCGNRQIRKQMKSMKGNIEKLEAINVQNGCIDVFYNNMDKGSLVKALSQSNSKFKLNYMGIPLVCEYLKGMGVDIVKPDVHICRILGRLGYSKKSPKPADPFDAIYICKEIAEENNAYQATVDTVLWQFCANDKHQLCTATPKCNECKVVDCNFRNNILNQ